MPPVVIIRKPIARRELKNHLLPGSALVKAVVDTEKNIMAVGGEMHADEEQALLEDGSAQGNLWGINLYPDAKGDDWLEFDSLINLRPIDSNRTRGVEDPQRQRNIRAVVASLVRP